MDKMNIKQAREYISSQPKELYDLIYSYVEELRTIGVHFRWDLLKEIQPCERELGLCVFGKNDQHITLYFNPRLLTNWEYNEKKFKDVVCHELMHGCNETKDLIRNPHGGKWKEYSDLAKEKLHLQTFDLYFDEYKLNHPLAPLLHTKTCPHCGAVFNYYNPRIYHKIQEGHVYFNCTRCYKTFI